MKKRLVSGIKPTGLLHIGNYLGAIKQFVELQKDYDTYLFVADLHAMTVPQDPKTFNRQILEIAAAYMAAGLDPEKVTIFQQSQIPAHSELCWILTTIANMGELSRMIQFKDKTEKIGNKESIGVGLFEYPILQAADILLYDADVVPVGEDQKQHVEITRDLAERFNKRFGKSFVVPQPLITKAGARIMSLDDPTKKMSKSDENPNSYISLTDTPEIIRKKIARAVTDSGSEIKYDQKTKPAITNLLDIFHLITNTPIEKLEKEYNGQGYGVFKQALAEAIVYFLAPYQQKFQALMAKPDEIRKVLKAGSLKANEIAEAKIDKIKQAVGLS
jgi:tryptophanyl-tRNA synthetase